jgi:hypothetical protein
VYTVRTINCLTQERKSLLSDRQAGGGEGNNNWTFAKFITTFIKRADD